MNFQISGTIFGPLTILGPLRDVLTSGHFSATLTSGDGGSALVVQCWVLRRHFPCWMKDGELFSCGFLAGSPNHCDDFAVPWLEASKVGVELFEHDIT